MNIRLADDVKIFPVGKLCIFQEHNADIESTDGRVVYECNEMEY